MLQHQFNIVQITICAGCNQYQKWAALVVGILSYFVYLIAQKIIKFAKSIIQFYFSYSIISGKKFQFDEVDDPVGVGRWIFFGLVFVALFKDDGVFLQPSLTSANVAYYDTFNYLR